MDINHLPEIRAEEPESSLRRYCRSLHDALIAWCEISPARVVNRSSSMGSNFSKPFQSQIIQSQGFAIPETLITNAPELVREFRHEHKRVIYKSISSERSVVHTLREEDLERLENVLWCPTQFQ